LYGYRQVVSCSGRDACCRITRHTRLLRHVVCNPRSSSLSLFACLGRVSLICHSFCCEASAAADIPGDSSIAPNRLLLVACNMRGPVAACRLGLLLHHPRWHHLPDTPSLQMLPGSGSQRASHAYRSTSLARSAVPMRRASKRALLLSMESELLTVALPVEARRLGCFFRACSVSMSAPWATLA